MIYSQLSQEQLSVKDILLRVHLLKNLLINCSTQVVNYLVKYNSPFHLQHRAFLHDPNHKEKVVTQPWEKNLTSAL